MCDGCKQDTAVMKQASIVPLGLSFNAVRRADDSWTGQVILFDRVIWENEGNSYETQAYDNVREDFVLLIRKLLGMADAEILAGGDEE